MDNPQKDNSLPNSAKPANECPPSCCSETKKNPNALARWLVFISIMVLALFIGAYSLINKSHHNSVMSNESIADQIPNAPDKLICGETLTSLHQLNIMAKTKNVAFIFLPGNDDQQNREISQRVTDFVNQTNQSDIITFTMQKNSEGYDQVINNFAINSYPSVVVLGRGCKSSAVTQDFSESKFTSALNIARIPMGSCGSGSSTCPVPCQK